MPDSPLESTDSTVHLLTYDHGGMVLWGRDHFVERLRSAVSWLDRYPSFKIGLDNEAYTYDYLAEHEPDVLAEIREYLRKFAGRFGIGTCTYGQPLSQFINEESNIRQIGYALEADRHHLGCAPPIYLMSEHAHHSQIPQILKGFGFAGAIMRTHFMMYGCNPTFSVPVGWWVGVDGSRIRAVPTYEGEGASFGKTTSDNWILTRYPGPESSTFLEEWASQFRHIRPLLASRADDAGLRKEDLVRLYEGRHGFRWILLEELLPAFPPPQADMKTGPDDFRVRMPWGYCGNEIWGLSRRAEVAVLTAERLAALAHLAGAPDREPEVRGAWKDLLVAQHHDVQICGLLPEARKFLPKSIAASERVAQDSLAYVAGRINTGPPGPEAPVVQITVFNPLSWRRIERLAATVELPIGAAQSIRLRPRRSIACSVTQVDRHGDGSLKSACITFRADVPALGFAAYALVPCEPAERHAAAWRAPGDHRISTPFYEVALARQGGLAAIMDRRTGRQILAAAKRACFLAGRIDGIERESVGSWSFLPTPQGSRSITARENGEIGGIHYALDVTFRADTPRIDLTAALRIRGQKIGRLSDDPRDAVSGFIHEEKLRLKLLPDVGARAVGVRDLPFVIAETGERYVEGNYWTAIADKSGGIAVFNRGCMGSVREQDGSFSVPLAFAMNYIWGTRMLDGEYTYDLALYPFAGPWKQADLHRRALEYAFPLVCHVGPPGSGDLGTRWNPIAVESPGAIVSALYTESGRPHLRLYEYRGRKVNMALRVPDGLRLKEVDLAGRETGDLAPRHALGPWQFRTLRMELAPLTEEPATC